MHTLPTDADFYAAIQRSTVFPCIATDADGLIRVFNVGAERLLRYAAPDLIGLRRFAGLCDPPELTARTRSAEEALELTLICGDGGRLPVTLSVSVLNDLQGDRIGYLLLAGDNRAHLREERDRTDRDAKLRQANKLEAIGTLAGGVAHDFNNILATILGNADLARDDAVGNRKVLECLGEIHRAGIRGRGLVQQILSFARKEDTALQPLLLEPVVRESARLLRATLPGRLSINMECEPGLPPITGDATQIMQVVINLATNALQAMPSGPGRLSIRLAAAPNSDFLLLTVRDTGCGMTPDVLARIFDPFFTTRPVGEGTGLGMSVVHGILQVHKGRIEVQSTAGEGTTVSVYFPSLLPQPVAALPQAVATVAPPLPSAAGRRVLYLDDEEALVSLVPRLLVRRGYRVTAFTDAGLALKALRAAPADFDLVLTDYNMPIMSGLDVAREARAVRADLPVVITTGYVDDTLRERAAAIGVREVVFKADNVADLCDALQRAVDSIPQGKAVDGN